jgi:hypothetical protein
MGRACSTYEEKRNDNRVFVGRPKGKGSLQRRRRMWEDNIKIYLRERGWGDVDWIDLAQDREQWRAVLNTAMKFRVP